MFKKIIISILCITTVLLSACGSESSNLKQDTAESSAETLESSSIADSSSNANNDNRIEYDDQVFYESSNLKISLKAIQLGYDYNVVHVDGDPYDKVKIELLVEALSDDDINYDANVIYINDYQFYTDHFYLRTNGHTKQITSFSVTKKDLEKAGIKYIEKIKFEDYYVDIGNHSRGYSKKEIEKLSNAELKLSAPYELKWE